jgi:ABC-2 type transport system permease protein
MIKMGGLGTSMLAFLALFLVIRHSRGEEEAGRLDVVGAAAVGRQAPLTAALAVGFATSLAIGLLSAGGLIVAGLPPAGSIAFGLAWAGAGCVFAAVGGVSAQLTTGGRAAVGLATAVLGVAYLLRAVGDATGSEHATWVSWLSPIGWAQHMRPFAGERWAVLLLLVVCALALTAGSFALSARRDLGSGVLADRPGAAVAAPSLASPAGLSWRLQRGAVLAWAAGVIVVGAIVGSIATQVEGILDNPAAKDLIATLGGTQALTDAYLALELGLLGSAVTILGMHTAMSPHAEEASWRADLVLSTATARARWLLGAVVIAVLVTAGVILLGGAASAAGYASQAPRADIGRVVLGAAVQIPAACVLIGIVVATFGLLPRFTTATWGVLVALLIIGQFGTVLGLPAWVMDLSPYAHVPRIPGGQVQAAPLLALSAIAAVLIAVGVAAFARRDVVGG